MTATPIDASANPAARPAAAVVDAAYPPAAQAWRMVGVLTVLYTLSLLDRQVISLLLDSIRKDLQISDFQVSLLQGLAFALFYAIFGLAFGRAVDRYSRRGVVAAGVSLWSLAAAACGLARNFTQLALARFGVGAGEAALTPAAYSMIADSFPKAKLAFAMAVFGIGATVGTGLSSGLGGLLIHLLPEEGLDVPLLGHLAPWRVVFLITGLPGLLLASMIFMVPEPVRRGVRSAQALPVSDTLRFMKSRWRFFLGHFVGFGLQSMCAYSLMAWKAMYLHRKFDWSIPQIGLVMVISAVVVGCTAQPLMGHVADRWFQAGRKDAHLRLFAIYGVLQIGLILAAVSVTNAWAAVVLFACWGMVSNCTGPAAAAIQIVTPNEFRGQISAAYILVFNLLGVGAGATIAGAFSTFLFRDDQMIGWSVFLTFAIFMPIAIGFLLSAMKPMRAAVAAAEA